MLVLTRKRNETIVIGGTITVKVLEVCGNKVRLGIVAPEEVSVDREEVARRRVEFQAKSVGEDSWCDLPICTE